MITWVCVMVLSKQIGAIASDLNRYIFVAKILRF